MRPIFHLFGHIALKFNIKPVCNVFLKTQDLKSLPISYGNSIFASKKGKIFRPISNVNFRLECNSLSCWKNFSYVEKLFIWKVFQLLSLGIKMLFWFDYAINKISVLAFPSQTKYVLVLPLVKCKKQRLKYVYSWKRKLKIHVTVN